MALRRIVPLLPLVLLTAALPPAASASVPSWMGSEILATGAGFGDIGIDGEGEITAVWGTAGGNSTVFATRKSGERKFQAPQALDASRSSNPKLAVNDAGGAIVVWNHVESSSCDGFACQSTLRAKLRRPGRAFGEDQPLPSSQGFASSDVAIGGGEAIVAWKTNSGGLRVMRGKLTGSLGAQQQLATAEEAYDAPFSLAVNDSGDAVIAWTEGNPQLNGIDVMTSYRVAGGSFGPPERLLDGQPATAYDPSVSAAIDGSGRAAVSFSPTLGELTVARRVKAGSWRTEPLQSGSRPQLVSNEAGNLLAWWTKTVPKPNDFPAFQTHLTLGSMADPFGPPVLVPGESGGSTLGGFDNLANAVFVWSGVLPAQRLQAGTFSRFGLRESQTLSADPAQPISLAVNRHGAIAALSFGFPPQGGDSYLIVVDRAADTSHPRVFVRSPKASLKAVTTTVRCDESCRARASVRLAKPKAKATASAAGPKRTRILEKTARGRLKVAIPRKLRAKLRREIRLTGKARVVLSVRAEDAAGNRRTIKRKLVLPPR